MNRINTFTMEDNLFLYNYRTDNPRYSWFHAHQGIELLYIHEGNGLLFIDQNVTSLQEGTLLLFQPFQLHKIDIKSDTYIRSIIVFNPAAVDEVLHAFPMYQSYLRQLWKGKLSHHCFQIQDRNFLETRLDKFDQILRCSSNRKEEFNIFLLEILQILKPEIEAIVQLPMHRKREMSYTERIMDWIELHYNEELRLNDLASILHLSPYYISHMFRKETGYSITEYTAARRLKEACHLLTTSTLLVNEIAIAIGLKNPAYFCHFFKKYMNLTPLQYREQCLRHFESTDSNI